MDHAPRHETWSDGALRSSRIVRGRTRKKKSVTLPDASEIIDWAGECPIAAWRSKRGRLRGGGSRSEYNSSAYVLGERCASNSVLLLSMIGESLGLHLTSTVLKRMSFSRQACPLGEEAPFSNAYASSLVNRSPNMFTLIGWAPARVFDSLGATFSRKSFPASFVGWMVPRRLL